MTSCRVALDAINCLFNNGCMGFSVIIIRISNDLQRLNCIEPPTPATQENATVCPDLPVVEGTGPSMSMPSPHAVLSNDLPSACYAPASHLVSWNQCSLFMDSQLRAFSGYRQGLETCSIPGNWVLLEHPSLRIEVEGTNMTNIEGATYTRLSKINVTINPSDCDPVAHTYVAQGSLPLSEQLLPPVENSGVSSAVQLTCDTNGTVVTLLVSWLSTAIVIRQYAGFLSITIKVPSQIASESKGLCTGCPFEKYINITQVYDQISSSCTDARSRAEVGCFVRGGVVNQDHLKVVRNNTYLDVCRFNLYKTGSIDVLTMISAITDDAKAITELPIATLPSVSPSNTQSPSSSSTPATTQSLSKSANSVSGARGLYSCSELTILLFSSLFLLLR